MAAHNCHDLKVIGDGDVLLPIQNILRSKELEQLKKKI